uniref:ZP domain-containing protein n=1 Tax=Romanomermis culicivorax TaxID=13658 RepID=A0A915KTP7_ROMCU
MSNIATIVAFFSFSFLLFDVSSFRTVQNISTKFVVSISKGQNGDADFSIKNNTSTKKRVKIASRQDSLPEIQMESKGEISNSSCYYEIRANDTNGNLINGAKIGDSIYYVINCTGLDDGEERKTSCIIIYNCTLISDDRSLNYPIIDEYGCSFDPSINESVEYDSDWIAGIRGQAIRFHGSPKIKLECKVRRIETKKSKDRSSSSCPSRRPKCVTNEYTTKSSIK